MLLHSDVPDWNCNRAWEVMERYYRSGKLRAIGISNFKAPEVEKLVSHATVKPMVSAPNPDCMHTPHWQSPAIRSIHATLPTPPHPSLSTHR